MCLLTDRGLSRRVRCAREGHSLGIQIVGYCLDVRFRDASRFTELSDSRCDGRVNGCLCSLEVFKSTHYEHLPF